MRIHIYIYIYNWGLGGRVLARTLRAVPRRVAAVPARLHDGRVVLRADELLHVDPHVVAHLLLLLIIIIRQIVLLLIIILIIITIIILTVHQRVHGLGQAPALREQLDDVHL